MRLLLCIDDLPTASDALGAARLLAGALTADLIVLAVAENDAAADVLLAAARAELAAVTPISEARAVGAAMEDAIALLCQGQPFDLVIFGPAGRRGIQRLLRGSRVLNLVRQASTSIWIARGPLPAIRRILVAISGAPTSEIDVRFAGYLARAFQARLTVLHVVSQVPLTFTGLAHLRYNLPDFLALDMPGSRQLQRAGEVLAELEVPGRLDVREGLVSDEVVGEAAEGYDLLVIGAHAGEGMAGLLLDNITEHIVRESPITTLVVRSEPQWGRLDAAASGST
jgi:nucleotide-binding universal stress UspA family protein